MPAIKFTESIVIKRKPEDVFDFTQDYTARLRWDSFLKRAELMNDATVADKGVRAYCVAKNGLGMVTEYVSFNRPKATAVKMISGPFLFRSFAGSWSFKPQNDDRTQVIFLYSFELRFPFKLLSGHIRRNLQSNVRQRLIDLKTCLEAQCE